MGVLLASSSSCINTDFLKLLLLLDFATCSVVVPWQAVPMSFYHSICLCRYLLDCNIYCNMNRLLLRRFRRNRPKCPIREGCDCHKTNRPSYPSRNYPRLRGGSSESCSTIRWALCPLGDWNLHAGLSQLSRRLIAPDNWFPANNSSLIFVRNPNSVGIVPSMELFSISKDCMLAIAPISVGIVPVNSFTYIHNCSKSTNTPSSLGIGQFNRLLLRYKSSTSSNVSLPHSVGIVHRKLFCSTSK
jgi:hypothetical protein